MRLLLDESLPKKLRESLGSHSTQGKLGKIVAIFSTVLASAVAQAGVELGQKALSEGRPVTAVQELYEAAATGDLHARRVISLSYALLAVRDGSGVPLGQSLLELIRLESANGNPPDAADDAAFAAAYAHVMIDNSCETISDWSREAGNNPIQRLSKLAGDGDPLAQYTLSDYYTHLDECGAAPRHTGQILALLNALWANRRQPSDNTFTKVLSYRIGPVSSRVLYFDLAQSWFAPGSSFDDDVKLDSSRLALRDFEGPEVITSDRVTLETAALISFHRWSTACPGIGSRPEEAKAECTRQWKIVLARLTKAADAGSSRAQAIIAGEQVQYRTRRFKSATSTEIANVVELVARPRDGYSARLLADATFEIERRAGRNPDDAYVPLLETAASLGDVVAIDRLPRTYARLGHEEKAFMWCLLSERFSGSERDPGGSPVEHCLTMIREVMHRAIDAETMREGAAFVSTWRPTRE